MNFLDSSYPDTDPTKQPLLSQSPSTTAVLSQLLPPSSYQYAPPVPHPHDVTDHTAARTHSRSPDSRSPSFQAASCLPTGVPGAATLVNEGSPFREAPPGALPGENSENKGGTESYGIPGKGEADKEGGADGVEAGGRGGGGGGGGEGGGFEDEPRYAPKSTRETVRAVVNKRFWQRFWGLLVLARAENSILIVALVAINIVVAAQVGKIPGSFILALVKRDWQLFWHAVWYGILWYGATSVCDAAAGWASEFLVIKWRLSLTRVCHDAYVRGPTLYKLAQGKGHDRAGKEVFVDNSDQRVCTEINQFCRVLSHLISKTITAPLMISYYTIWVFGYVGWTGCFWLYLFFFTGALTAQMVLNPIAALVAKLEEAEADFRIGHVRLLQNSESIALLESEEVEAHHIAQDFGVAVAFQKKIVDRHLLLSLVTRGFASLGTLLNYAILGLPILSGAFLGADEAELAQIISVASFAVLQLISSFSNLVSASTELSDCAGYANRVAELFETLGLLPLPRTFPPGPLPPPPSIHRTHTAQAVAQGEGASGSKSKGVLSKHAGGFIDRFLRKRFPPSGMGGRFSKYGALNQSPRAKIARLPPRLSSPPPAHQDWDEQGGRGGTLEVAGKEEGAMALNCLLTLLELEEVAPAWRLLLEEEGWGEGEPVERVEHVAIDMSEEGEGEGERVGESASDWVQALCQSLLKAGLWAAEVKRGAVLPEEVDGGAGAYLIEVRGTGPGQGQLVGRVLTSSSLAEVREVMGEQLAVWKGGGRVLGGEVTGGRSREGEERTGGGTRSSPAKLTLAQEKETEEAFLTGSARRHEGSVGSGRGWGWGSKGGGRRHKRALVLEGLTVRVQGSGMLVVRDLSLKVGPASSVLVMGPSGSGKSSLIRAISGLWPKEAGKIHLPPPDGGRGVLYLPQTPILARGGLAAQITYPEPPPLITPGTMASPNVVRLHEALHQVGMDRLLARAGGSWEEEMNWGDILSGGERQSLSLARVLYLRPALAVLDEATSAIHEEAASAIYGHIMALGIAVLSVSHAPALKRHHRYLLQIKGDRKGSWSLEPSGDFEGEEEASD